MKRLFCLACEWQQERSAAREVLMKLMECVPALAMIGLCLASPAWSDIYIYSTGDGTVNLSNVPTGSHYAVMLPAQQEARPATDIYKPPLKLANKVQYDRIVAEIAHTYGLDSALLHAVISVESRYSPNAVSRKGAAGLMQLMPGTAKQYGVTDSFDPVQNLHGGARHLQYLLKIFNNDISLALAAYNAGEGSVAKHGNRIPPFRETAKYVPQVLGFYQRYQAE